MSLKYQEVWTPGSGYITTSNTELVAGGSALQLKWSYFVVDTTGNITFVTPGGDTVTMSATAKVLYKIPVVKITAYSAGVVWIRHNGIT